MEEEQQKNESQLSKENTEPLAGWPLSFYLHLLRWPILVVWLVNIFLIAFDQNAIYTWFVDLVVFAVLTWLAVKKHQASQLTVMIIGLIGGLLMGAGIALIKLIKIRQLYAFFYLISDPLLTAFVGLIIGSLVYFTLTKGYRAKTSYFKPAIFNKNSRKEIKNGREKNNGQR